MEDKLEKQIEQLLLDMNSFDKEINLLELIYLFIRKKKINLNLKYSQEFLDELKKFIKNYHFLRNKKVMIENLLIDTSDRDYSLKADYIFEIKRDILSRFDKQSLFYLQKNHYSLINFLHENKMYLDSYKENKYIRKERNPKNKQEYINFFILKAEYELMHNTIEKYKLFHKEYKSVILKDTQYNKPVYIGLKHLHQCKSNIYMEGPFFNNKVKCPCCGEKIIHLLEGLTKTGSIYACSNLNCKFFINGNYLLKRGHQDLINFFDIKKEIVKTRHTSHQRIYETLKQITEKRNQININTEDNFCFTYSYLLEENWLGLRLNKISYKDKKLYLSNYYAKRTQIYNFIHFFVDKYIGG